jgi:hypothetical protein
MGARDMQDAPGAGTDRSGGAPRWGVAAADAERTAEAVLDLFIAGIAGPPGTE